MVHWENRSVRVLLRVSTIKVIIMATKSIPAWAKYVVLGYYEDEQEEDWPIQYFKDRESAEEFAYDYEAQHDGIIRTTVKKVKSNATVKPKAQPRPAKPVVKTVPKKEVKKPAVKKVLPNGYALMYLAHPEDVEMGADKNRWVTFKINGQTVTHFSTLEGLLKAIMSQLKPSGKWHYADIYKCSGGKKYYYAELTISPWDWEVKDFVYLNGNALANNTTLLAVRTKTPGESKWYAVFPSGKTMAIRYKRDDEKAKSVATPKAQPKAKTEDRPRSKSPFDEIDDAFSKGKSMIRFW